MVYSHKIDFIKLQKNKLGEKKRFSTYYIILKKMVFYHIIS